MKLGVAGTWERTRPVGARIEQAATVISKLAVSRRLVAATETALAELLAAELSGLDLVALMVDGVHFGEYCCVVALRIDIEGVKHPLSLWKLRRRTPLWCVSC